MITIKHAIKIAETYLLDQDSKHDLAILHDHTVVFELGWVFFYQTKKYIETGDFNEMTGENPPIIINSSDGTLFVTGTTAPVEKYVREYVNKFKV